MKKLTILLTLFGFSLFSCSPAPQVAGRSFSQQQKFEAAHHWEVLAEDFSKQLSLYLQDNPLNKIGSGYIVEGTSVPDHPYIYIQTNDRSIFGKAFRQSLVTKLTKIGYPIAYRPNEETVTLRWSVQKIKHAAARRMNTVPGTYTALAALGSGVYKLYADSSVIWGVLATGAFLDVLDQTDGYAFKKYAPHSEINLAITLSQAGVLLARQSGAYYVNDEDLDHYTNIPDFEGQKEAHLEDKEFTVVSD